MHDSGATVDATTQECHGRYHNNLQWKNDMGKTMHEKKKRNNNQPISPSQWHWINCNYFRLTNNVHKLQSKLWSDASCSNLWCLDAWWGPLSGKQSSMTDGMLDRANLCGGWSALTWTEKKKNNKTFVSEHLKRKKQPLGKVEIHPTQGVKTETICIWATLQMVAMPQIETKNKNKKQ